MASHISNSSRSRHREVTLNFPPTPMCGVVSGRQDNGLFIALVKVSSLKIRKEFLWEFSDIQLSAQERL